MANGNPGNEVGGGIIDEGTLMLRNVRLVFNRAGSAGGGIFNGGTIMLRFTLVAFNSPDNCTPRGTIRGCHR